MKKNAFKETQWKFSRSCENLTCQLLRLNETGAKNIVGEEGRKRWVFFVETMWRKLGLCRLELNSEQIDSFWLFAPAKINFWTLSSRPCDSPTDDAWMNCNHHQPVSQRLCLYSALQDHSIAISNYRGFEFLASDVRKIQRKNFLSQSFFFLIEFYSNANTDSKQGRKGRPDTSFVIKAFASK